MVAAAQFQTYTVEEFLTLELPEGQEYELTNGIITPMAEPSGEHENLRSALLVELTLESRRCQLGLLIHPKPVLQLGTKDTRKPDLIAIDRAAWNATIGFSPRFSQIPISPSNKSLRSGKAFRRSSLFVDMSSVKMSSFGDALHTGQPGFLIHRNSTK